jgi:hypothetical protein
MTTEKPSPSLHAKPGQTGLDPRGPRFGAAITGVLLLTVIALSLLGASVAATILFAAIVLIFAWATFAGIQRHPYGQIFKRLIRPRLKPPTELEDPVPPTFAQGVGLVITGLGLILALVGVPFALPIAAGLAFIAAFLNSVFGYCLGCQIYLALVRARILGRSKVAAA